MKLEYEALKAELLIEKRRKVLNEFECSDAIILRGECIYFCSIFHDRFPHLTIVLGFYNGGHNEHAWLTEPNGTIIDPTIEQFAPCARWQGPGEYSPHSDGKYRAKVGCCPNCGDDILEGDDNFGGVCSDECARSYAAWIERECRRYGR